jgi:hypothetical protein
MTCDEKVLLQRRYARATGMYTDALTFLSARIGTVDKQEYERLRYIAERFRKASDYARMELEKHTADHGCWEDGLGASAMPDDFGNPAGSSRES